MRDTLSWATYPDHCQCRQQLNHSCEIQSSCLDVRSQQPPQVMVMTILIIHLIPAVFRCVILVWGRLYGKLIFDTKSLGENLLCLWSLLWSYGFWFSLFILVVSLLAYENSTWLFLVLHLQLFHLREEKKEKKKQKNPHSLGSAWSLSTGMTLYILYYNNAIWQSWDGEKC